MGTAVKNETVLVVADCTGHGVSGAFMTLIGNMLLNNIIKTERVHKPDIVLEKLDWGVRKVLKQDKTKSMNGMDVIITFLARKQHNTMMRCASARRPIFWSENQTIRLLEGTKHDVGGIQPIRKSFQSHTLQLTHDTMLYLGTDGFRDQNNPFRRRYGSVKLKQLLKEIHQLPLPEQMQRLEEEIQSYAKGAEQRDDMLWIGVRF